MRKNNRRYWDLYLTGTGREKHLLKLDCSLSLRWCHWHELPPSIRQRLTVMWRGKKQPQADHALASLVRDSQPRAYLEHDRKQRLKHDREG